MKMQFNYLFVIFLFISSIYSSKVAEKVEATTVSAQDDTTNRIANLEANLAKLTSQLGGLAGTSRYTSDGVDLRDYMYRDALIYQDIFNAYNSNIFVKRGSPR